MFPSRYFPDRYFAPRYWAKHGATAVVAPAVLFGPYQQLPKKRRRDVEAAVYGFQARFTLGFVSVVVDAAIRRSVAAEMWSAVGMVTAETDKRPSAAEYDRLLNQIDDLDAILDLLNEDES